MTILSQTEAGKILGIPQSIIGRYLKKGYITRYEKAKVCLEEIQSYRETKPTNVDENSSETRPKQSGSDSKQAMTYNAARTHREAFNAKLAEVTYKERIGELITIEDAKGIIEIMFSPLSRKLDDLHIDLKSRYPNIEMEAIEWLSDYVNDIKKSVSEHKW